LAPMLSYQKMCGLSTPMQRFESCWAFSQWQPTRTPNVPAPNLASYRRGAMLRVRDRMKRLIEVIAVGIGALMQGICASVDLEVISLPSGSLIAILLALYAIAMTSIRHAVPKSRASAGSAQTRGCTSPRSPSDVPAASCLLISRNVAFVPKWRLLIT
jgi:hypothetical protein